MVFSCINEGFGSYKETIEAPVDVVLNYFDYIIFKNKIENFRDD